jgi:hypothetical protein
MGHRTAERTQNLTFALDVTTLEVLPMTILTTKTHKLLGLLFLLLVGISGLSAQTNYGALRGEVKDTQGASIRDAKVTLTNQATGVVRTDVTNSTGSYLFGGIDPGTYKVSIAMPGFKGFDVSGNIVTLGSTTTVDAALQIGAATESVDVTADSLVLNTANGSGGQLFSEQQIQTLPSLGRNPFLMAALDANVVTLGDPRYVRAEDQTGGSQVSVAGAPSFSNSYAVDGIPVSTSQGGLTFIPSPEAVSESKVQSNTYDAEIGRTGGGIFATSLKVGSAQYHGVLYGETRQTNWSGNVWFNFPSAANGGQVSPTPNNATYLYSGAFGGPLLPSWVKKPHWLDNTFFWVTEEGYRQGQPNTSNTTAYFVPTAAERAGDFSADSVTLYDPTQRNSAGVSTCRLSKFGDCGVGGAGDTLNVVPASYINPIGSYVLGQFPAAQNTLGYGAAGNAFNYSFTNQSFKSRSDEYVGKLEHTFAPWWTASASYLHNAIQEPAPSILVVKYANATKLLRYTDSTIVNNTFTINPTTLLTVAYGFNRYYSAAFQYSSGFNAATGFGGAGFSSAFANLLQSPTFPTFGFSNVTNGTGLGASNSGPTVYASNNVATVLSKTLGKHNLKFGYALRAFAVYSNPTSGGAGSFTFNGQYTSANGKSGSANGAGAFADLLVGAPSSASLTLNSGAFVNQIKYDALFAQDDVRINSKLTVNVGVRYEYEAGQSERHNRFNRGFDPNAVSTYTGVNGPVSVKGGLAFAGLNGAPSDCCNNSHLKFSPRIGLAYQIEPKLVLHAGYGVYFSPAGITTGATTGYSQSSAYSPGNATGNAPVGANAYLNSPFSTSAGPTAGVVTPTGNSLGALTGIGGSLGSTTVTSDIQDFSRRYPFVEQYSVDLERQLPKDVLVKISYIGAHARNFANATNINQLSDSVLASYAPGGANAGTDLSVKVANPYYATTVGGLPATGVLASSTIAKGQLLLPFPQFGAVTVTRSTGYSNYNSLSVKVQKQMTKGLTVLGTYTWAANWDNIWSTGSQIYNNYGPQDGLNPKGEYARSLNSIPNRATMALTYDLPVGKGRKFLGHPGGVVGNIVDALIGGYQINDETILQNGVPISLIQTDLSTQYGVTGIGGLYQRPNLAGDIHSACGAGRPQGRLGSFGTAYINGASTTLTEQPYVKPTGFTAAQAYTYGNAPRTLPCRVPGTNASTVSVNKTFVIHERFNLQFRAEALNVFNTPQFGAPSSSLTVSQASAAVAPNPVATGSAQPFGNITSTVGFARIIQMGGRLSF